MRECPECSAAVPTDGNFCPECGTRITGARNEQSGRAESAGQADDWRSEEDEEWDYPVDPDATAGPRVEDHKLLLGSVVGISIVGVLQSLYWALSPQAFADSLVEIATETGIEIEPGYAEQIILVTGVLGIVIVLVVLGVTVRNYRANVLPRRYFWVLIAAGVTGLLLANNLFLAALAILGIYGLVVVH